MSTNRWSLTEVHNRLESASDRNTEIVSLRKALSKLDADIAQMYGWKDVADTFNQILPADKGGYRDHLSSSGLDVEVLKRLQELNASESGNPPTDHHKEKAPLLQSRKMRDFTKLDSGQLKFEI